MEEQWKKLIIQEDIQKAYVNYWIRKIESSEWLYDGEYPMDITIFVPEMKENAFFGVTKVGDVPIYISPPVSKFSFRHHVDDILGLYTANHNHVEYVLTKPAIEWYRRKR
jgi:hypothetical protein